MVPVREIAEATCKAWYRANMHAVVPEEHVQLQCLVRGGSVDLNQLFNRATDSHVPMANDTSIGTAYAPLSILDSLVLEIEFYLRKLTGKGHPSIGEDIKVMGVRRDNAIDITVACALVDSYVSNTEDYAHKVRFIHDAVLELASARYLDTPDINVRINAADDIAANSIYLTVTGCSAESGDDGQVGRGNRHNGLITPCRPMSLEALAGKNPISHIGKLYNIVALSIVNSIIDSIESIAAAECLIVSKIGSPITEPQSFETRIALHDDAEISRREQDAIHEIAMSWMEKLPKIWESLIFAPLN